MYNLWLVGSGGFIGSVARYYLGGWVTQSTHVSRFPYGTLLVNVTGCFLIGLLAGGAEHAHWMKASTRLFLLTGFLGGFTTYSAFAYETFSLGRGHFLSAALANVVFQLILGFAAVALGFRLALAVGR
jgi:CrcB protein